MEKPRPGRPKSEEPLLDVNLTIRMNTERKKILRLIALKKKQKLSAFVSKILNKIIDKELAK